MFAKLLKYEWRSIRGMVGLLCLITLSAAAVGGLAMRYLVWVSDLSDQSELGVVLAVLTMIFALIAIGVCGMGIQLYPFWRFFKSRFTDEGYLTFTLPVTAHQILLSSFVTCLLGSVCALAALVVGYAALVLLGISVLEDFFPTVWQVLPSALENLGRLFTSEVRSIVGMLTLEMVVGVLANISILLLSITVGSILAKKHKVLAAVGIYYGINMALSLITGVLGVFQGIASTVAAQDSGVTFFTTMILWYCALFLLVAVGGYFLTHFLISRKLNLN